MTKRETLLSWAISEIICALHVQVFVLLFLSSLFALVCTYVFFIAVDVASASFCYSWDLHFSPKIHLKGSDMICQVDIKSLFSYSHHATWKKNFTQIFRTVRQASLPATCNQTVYAHIPFSVWTRARRSQAHKEVPSHELCHDDCIQTTSYAQSLEYPQLYHDPCNISIFKQFSKI